MDNELQGEPLDNSPAAPDRARSTRHVPRQAALQADRARPARVPDLVHGQDLEPRGQVVSVERDPEQAELRLPARPHAHSAQRPEDAADGHSIPRPRKAR